MKRAMVLLAISAATVGIGAAVISCESRPQMDVSPPARPAPAVTTRGARVGQAEGADRSTAAAPALASPEIDPARIAALDAKPLYEFSEADVDVYLRHLHASEPDLRKRIVALARKNVGEPYEIYLLGEAPFETIDAQPVYCLNKSDCVVFAEHTLAMALSDGFPQFMRVLQRIRYKDGQIGVTTRNHYTEADWNPNNRWLVRDITEELAGPEGVIRFDEKIDRARFFKDRYKLDRNDPVEVHQDSFIPYEKVDASLKSRLRDGDLVNFVSGQGKSFWVGHVGLVATMPDGSVHLIHSTSPRVREEPIEQYIARFDARRSQNEARGKAVFRGFKFLRIEDDPMANLRAIDGPDAPHVSVPAGSAITFDQYVNSIKLNG